MEAPEHIERMTSRLKCRQPLMGMPQTGQAVPERSGCFYATTASDSLQRAVCGSAGGSISGSISGFQDSSADPENSETPQKSQGVEASVGFLKTAKLDDTGLELSRKSQENAVFSGSVVLPVVLSAPDAISGGDHRAVALTALANVWSDLPDEVIAGILKLVRDAAGANAARCDT